MDDKYYNNSLGRTFTKKPVSHAKNPIWPPCCRRHIVMLLCYSPTYWWTFLSWMFPTQILPYRPFNLRQHTWRGWRQDFQAGWRSCMRVFGSWTARGAAGALNGGRRDYSTSIHQVDTSGNDWWRCSVCAGCRNTRLFANTLAMKQLMQL